MAAAKRHEVKPNILINKTRKAKLYNCQKVTDRQTDRQTVEHYGIETNGKRNKTEANTSFI